MNGIKGKKSARRQLNRLLDAVVTIPKYKKSTIYHDIYIKVFADGTVSYLTVSNDDGLNTTNNENAFPELTRVFKEHFDIKVQEVSVLKCRNIYGHVLMGRPAARLETMVLVIRSYVVV